jgi:hypothetical protein
MNRFFGLEKIIKTLTRSLKTIYQTFPFVKNIRFKALTKASLNLIHFLIYRETRKISIESDFFVVP